MEAREKRIKLSRAPARRLGPDIKVEKVFLMVAGVKKIISNWKKSLNRGREQAVNIVSCFILEE